MRELLTQITEFTVLVIDAMALVLVIVGTVMAFGSSIKLMFNQVTGHERREVWLKFSRWLVAALTFQLAADIIESSITTSWTAVGRLAAIAVIRTFLNYFLERDLNEVRERERESRTEDRHESIGARPRA